MKSAIFGRVFLIFSHPGEGVIDVKKKKSTTERIGFITLSRLNYGKGFQLRWVDPETGRDVRKVLQGVVTVQEARKAATESNHRLAEEIASGPRELLPTIHDSIAKAIRLSRQRDYVRLESGRQARMFEDWLLTRKPPIDPKVQTFLDVPRSMLKEYVLDMEKDTKERKGLAWESVNKRLKPIRAAWMMLADDFPDQMRPWPKKLQTQKPRKEVECLGAAEVNALLEWLRVNGPAFLWRFSVVMALTGLRPSEIRSLRRQDVNAKDCLISIETTESHKTKSETSQRIIPVCRESMEAIVDEMNSQTVIFQSGEVFINPEDHQPWTKLSLEKWWRKSKRKRIADGTGFPRIADFTQYTLRRSFATMAGQLGVSDRVLRAYMGHAPISGDMLGGHYRAVPVDEKRLVSNAFESWRELIEIEAVWQISGGKSEKSANY